MKIKCTCNNVIVDQTDTLKNKGYVISDLHWFEMWDAIDQLCVQPKGGTMQLSKQSMFKQIWECPRCGKLFVESEGNDLVSYTPDECHRLFDPKDQS